MISRIGARQHPTWRFLALIALGLLATLTAWLPFAPAGRAHARAALLVMDLMSRSPNSLLHTLTKPPTAEPVTIPAPAGPVEAQFYQPAGEGPHGALILVLGYPSNINDPQLSRVADDLARLGFVVLVPRLPGLRTGQLTHQDVDVLVTTFEWLAARPKVDPTHIGLSGFCVGSSLALVAAEDPRINERVAMVNAFGGYYDLLSLLRATAAHSAYYEGQEYPWQPDRQTIALFAQNVLLFTDDPTDRAILTQHFLQNGEDSGQSPEGLTLFGSLVYALLTTTYPPMVDALLAQITPDKLAQAAMISPSAGIERLKAKVFIMHDVSDPFVPVTESYRLADAITDPGQKVYAQFVLFDHVRPTQSLSRLTLAQEAIRLFFYLGRMLAEITPSS